ncbi:hypothetical protein MUK66_gp10 [Bacillus phage Aurora]|uniref:Uncharacterized protein n=2 Tax=Claudivirus TaxID=2842609 RepID=A0A7T7K7V2_9CAUD|nr:hypothetical protein MUK66_gp10 [Bacillus phage Aurora]YP_010114382.1 hypothetical protein KNV72_gp13 [Bacillus phage Thornton]ANT41124.1 hypothetical protein AURORA_10 [Bacillus phage Aurora]QQM15004.1 hypothetical protein THORNTON_13 [Bacillus phage Thornton]
MKELEEYKNKIIQEAIDSMDKKVIEELIKAKEEYDKNKEVER